VLGLRSRFGDKVHRALHQELQCFDRWLPGHAITDTGAQYPATGAATRGWSCPSDCNSFGNAYVTAAVQGVLFPIIPHKGIQTQNYDQNTGAAFGHFRIGNKITVRRIKVSGQFCGPDQGGGSDPNDLFPAWVRFGIGYFEGANIEAGDISYLDFWDVSSGSYGTGMTDEARVQLFRKPYTSAVTSISDYSQSQFKVVKNRTWQLQRAPATAEGSSVIPSKQQRTFHWNLKLNKDVAFTSPQSTTETLTTLDRNWYFYCWSSLDDDLNPGPQGRVLLNWLRVRVYYTP